MANWPGTTRTGAASRGPEPGGDRFVRTAGRRSGAGRRRPQAGTVMLWGRRPVAAALANPARGIGAIVHTPAAAGMLARVLADLDQVRRACLPGPQPVEPAALAGQLPPGAVHQGLAVRAAPLPQPTLASLLAAGDANRLLVVLDQVTDPRNVGAVMRSAAAFGAAAVLVQARHSPPPDGTLARAASGALERLPLVPVTNIARALEQAADRGFWRVGLAGEAGPTLADAHLAGRTALVLGAEGDGLRRLTRTRCDQLVRISTDPSFASLNISAAAAIALHEVRRAVPQARGASR